MIKVQSPWEKIAFVLATPTYDGNGNAIMDEDDMAELAGYLDGAAGEYIKLIDEVERLRAALHTIANNLDVIPGKPPTLEDAQEVAEGALAR